MSATELDLPVLASADQIRSQSAIAIVDTAGPMNPPVDISKNSVNGNQRRVIRRTSQVDRDYDNDGIDDRYENRTNVRNDQVWYDAGKGNGKGHGNGKYKDKGSKKH